MTTADKLTRLKTDFDEVYDKAYEQGKAEGGEFIGVKYSEFDKVDNYLLPTVADARSLDKCITTKNIQQSICYGLFAGGSSNNNNNFSAGLKTVYMPTKMTMLTNTFTNCRSLTTIIGDLTNVTNIGGAFDNCLALKAIPYFPNLKTFQNNAVRNCTSLTSITFYKVLDLWHTGALKGCTNIETINLVDGWNTSIYAQYCSKLTSECVDNMISCLADMTGSNAPTINFHADVKAKLSNEQITTITGKNWTLP